MPQIFRAPQITLPEELLDIHRFMSLFNSLIEGPISCDLVNGLPRYPQAGSVLEFTFEVTPTANHVRHHLCTFTCVLTAFQIPGITENTMEVRDVPCFSSLTLWLKCPIFAGNICASIARFVRNAIHKLHQRHYSGNYTYRNPHLLPDVDAYDP